MKTLQCNPAFDWQKVRWARDDDHVSYVCSACGAPVDGEEDFPLRLMGDNRHAVFCDPCGRLAFVSVEE